MTFGMGMSILEQLGLKTLLHLIHILAVLAITMGLSNFPRVMIESWASPIWSFEECLTC